MNTLGFLSPDALAELEALIDRRVQEQLGGRVQSPASPWLHGQKAIGDYLGVPVSTIEKWTAANVLPVYRLDGGRRLSARRDELDQWAQDFREGPPTGLPPLRAAG